MFVGRVRGLLAGWRQTRVVRDARLERRVAGGDWPAARVAMAERLWGAGWLGPGEEAAMARLGMRVRAGQRVVLVGELGAGARQVLAGKGVAVTQYCADSGLAAAMGAEVWDRGAPDFGVGCCEMAVAVEPFVLSGGEDWAAVLEALGRAVVPMGQMVVTALVADGTGEALVGAGLRRAGFGVRGVTDLTAWEVAAIREGWAAAMAGLPLVKLGEAEQAALLAEEARWRGRLERLAGGRLLGWHADGKSFR